MRTKTYVTKSLTRMLFIPLLVSVAYSQGQHRPPQTTLAPAVAQSQVIVASVQAPAGVATITLDEQFFNAFLEAIYKDLKPPSASLAITAADQGRASGPAGANACPDEIVLERENNGIKTAVKFEPGRVVAPLAFSGSYNSTLMGCLQLSGWADTRLNLDFDKARQTLTAHARVVDVHLNNIPSLASGALVKIVQSAIDRRINPIEILRLDQLSARVPVAASGGALRLQAKEVTPEIVPGVLHLHIHYEFVAGR